MKGGITVSRLSNKGDTWIEISIEDNTSGICFVEFSMSLDDFARAVTGCGGVPGDMFVRGLENVGKKRERDTIRYTIPKDTPFDQRKEVAYEEGLKHCPEGWILSAYFGASDSIDYNGNVKADIVRYVDLEEGVK